MGDKMGVRITVVVEDKRLASFAKNILRGFGFSEREITVKLPLKKRSGNIFKTEGSGKDYVTNQYRKELVTYRGNRNHQQVSLLIATDADEQTVAKRIQTLDTQLPEKDKFLRKPDHRIIYWIPKRNIETWIYFLSGKFVNEDMDFKHKVYNINWKLVSSNFMDHFARYSQGKLSVIPSLNTAFEETKRLQMP